MRAPHAIADLAVGSPPVPRCPKRGARPWHSPRPPHRAGFNVQRTRSRRPLGRERTRPRPRDFGATRFRGPRAQVIDHRRSINDDTQALQLSLSESPHKKERVGLVVIRVKVRGRDHARRSRVGELAPFSAAPASIGKFQGNPMGDFTKIEPRQVYSCPTAYSVAASIPRSVNRHRYRRRGGRRALPSL